MPKTTKLRLLSVVLGVTLSYLTAPAGAQEQPSLETMPPEDTDEPAPPPPLPALGTSRVELVVIGIGGYVAFYPTPSLQSQPSHEYSWHGHSITGATVYLRPLVDDDTPLALQPFLQRATTFRLLAEGGGFDTRVELPGQRVAERSFEHGGGRFDVDAYVRPNLILAASLAADYSTDTNIFFQDKQPFGYRVRTLLLSPSVGVGFRFANTLIQAAYTLLPYNGIAGWQVPFWGGVRAAVRTVIMQRIDLSLSLALLDQGATGKADVAVYGTKKFAIFGTLLYAHGISHFDDHTIHDWVTGAAGVSYWISRRFGGSLSYDLTWTGGTLPTLDHILTLALVSRI